MNHEVISNLNTGDLLLFSEHTELLSIRPDCVGSCIQLCSKSIYTHVAFVIKNPQDYNIPIPPLNDNDDNNKFNHIYILESTGTDRLRDGEFKIGVQLNLLTRVLKYFDGAVFVRKLVHPRDESFDKKIYHFYCLVNNLPYDYNPVDWIGSLFTVNKQEMKQWTNVKKKSMFICSALVAFMYVFLNLLSEKTPWTIVSPKDFGTEKRLNKRTLLFTNCTVEKEVEVFRCS